MKTIFITGGAVRIGKVIAVYFKQKGWNVGIQYHRSKDQAFDLLKNYGIIPFEACLDHENSYNHLVDDVYEKLGEIDVFVHNAARFSYDSLETCTRESWDFHFEANLRAPFVLSQNYIQKKLPKEKNIIFLIDQRVLAPSEHFMSYTLSKSALWTLTKTMAMAAAPFVRVNGIGPGPVLPDQYLSQERFEQQCLKTLLRKSVDPVDIAKTVEFIVNTPSLTGQMITLDSGQHLSK